MNLIEICYEDADVLVCVKPPRVLSTDEPGGLPSLLRETLMEPQADIRTVHRLDRVVGGLMVLARNPRAASELSVRYGEGAFEKQYWAVLHGTPEQKEDTLCDLLGRDKARKMTFVADAPAKGVQEAVYPIRCLPKRRMPAMVQIQLHTGQTHRFGCSLPLGATAVGRTKVFHRDDPCEIALFSQKIGFFHPKTGEWMEFRHEPPSAFPWDCFQ